MFFLGYEVVTVPEERCAVGVRLSRVIVVFYNIGSAWTLYALTASFEPRTFVSLFVYVDG